jgi:group II intron reverse transcriptase/maturase
LNEANREGKDKVMARAGGIVTPQKVRELQRRPCRKTKENKRWRAWTLYGELTRQDILETAARTVVRNAGAAGPDGQTTMQLKANMDAMLKTLRDELREHRYKPGAVKRVWIPKAGGKRRPLGIPNVRDRVVQTALLLLLEPIFEAVFNEHSYAYRPKRSAQDAVNAIREALRRGRTEVMDADLSAYFDTIDHAALLKLVTRKVSDGSILRLLKAILRAPVIEHTQRGTRIQANRTGTPQGGVISPLLANLYLNSLDHAVNENPEHDAELVRYADDFVLLCRPGKSGPLYERLKRYLEAKKLKLNETKTRVVDSRRENFSFLGFEFSNRRSVRKGTRYVHVEPARKARQQLRETVRRELNRWTIHESCAQAVRTVNAIVRGWSNYYYWGHCTRVFNQEQNWVRQRLRNWLWRKYGSVHAKYKYFSDERLEGQYRLWRMPLKATWTESRTEERSRKAGCGRTARPV